MLCIKYATVCIHMELCKSCGVYVCSMMYVCRHVLCVFVCVCMYVQCNMYSVCTCDV